LDDTLGARGGLYDTARVGHGATPEHPLVARQLLTAEYGILREGATEGALKLQNAGLIDYPRGRIQVLDQVGLEKRTCECYAVVKKEYDRLLPDKLAA